MDDLQMRFLIDLHKSNYRQDPGGEAETKQALKLAGLDRSRPLKIADIGCGTGASTILLAKHKYLPVDRDGIYKEVFEQAENFKKYQGVK